MQAKKTNPHIDEQVILGLDIGIGSVGWCLLRENTEAERTKGEIVFEVLASQKAGGQIVPSLGARCMDVPENAKDKSLLNEKRRTARGGRRVIKRRARKMHTLRRLIAESFCKEVLDVTTFHEVHASQYNPWNLRKEGLTRLLAPVEFAVVLLHLCNHRGFKSNSKKDATDKEGGAVLSAIKNIKEHLHMENAATFGAYMAEQKVQRNRQGFDGSSSYTNTPSRLLLIEEAHLLFKQQREFGSSFATEELEKKFIDLAFTQLPLKPVTHAVGKCAFLEDEPRAPACSPTAERFRLAQRLTTLRIQEGQPIRTLAAEEIRLVLDLLGKQKGVTYKALRKLLSLTKQTEFVGLSAKAKEKDPESRDVTGRSVGCGLASYILWRRLGKEGYVRLRDAKMENGLFCLDVIAKILSEFDGIEVIVEELAKLPVNTKELAALQMGVQEGDFAQFKGTANLSLKAMYSIMPHMVKEGDYAKGCELAGFDHTKVRPVDMNDIKNPVVSKVISEVRHQVRAIVKEFNVIPGRVHIELLRDVGKSIKERKSIEDGQNKQRDANEQLRKELAGHFGEAPEAIESMELRRYALWKQQGGKCAYYLLCSAQEQKKMYTGAFIGGGIPVIQLRNSLHSTQIDHILPVSRTSDNSFHNQVLCIAAANQNKKNKTPFEWLGQQNKTEWHAFGEWVKKLNVSGLKKRNLLMQNLDEEKENTFHARNLNDSRYAARLSMEAVLLDLQEENAAFTQEDGKGKRRIFARSGAITHFLRRRWGVNSLKFDETQSADKKSLKQSKERMNDKHHALDAMVVAICSERMLQKITKFLQDEEENEGRTQKKLYIPQPKIILPEYAGAEEAGVVVKNAIKEPLILREGAKKLLDKVMVSRAERGKIKGALHEETLRSIRTEKLPNNTEVKMLYERKNVSSLTIKDLERIKDPHRNQDVIEALREWIWKGKPKEDPPCLTYVTKNGKETTHILRRVQLQRGVFASGIEVPRGSGVAQADNASWVRADVYTKEGKYFVVPVYTWQVAKGICPVHAIAAHMPEDKWPEMDASFAFCFSLSSNAYVMAIKKEDVTEGYYLGMDRSTGSMTVADANDRKKEMSIGTRTLSDFRKYRVDRMGRLHLVSAEPDPRIGMQGDE